MDVTGVRKGERSYELRVGRGGVEEEREFSVAESEACIGRGSRMGKGVLHGYTDSCRVFNE